MDCFIARSINWCDILGAHSESIFPFMQYFFFLSRKLCFLRSTCPLLIAESISLDTSGKPTVGFSWVIFPLCGFCNMMPSYENAFPMRLWWDALSCRMGDWLKRILHHEEQMSIDVTGSSHRMGFAVFYSFTILWKIKGKIIIFIFWSKIP